MKKHLTLTLIGLLSMGCGQTGALYLPKNAQSNSSQSSSSAANEATQKKQIGAQGVATAAPLVDRQAEPQVDKALQ